LACSGSNTFEYLLVLLIGLLVLLMMKLAGFFDER